MRIVAGFVVAAWACSGALAQEPATRPLSFEERVAAQDAIERVYYRHQIGATRPFEEAVPREVPERKVRTYLEETTALRTYWHTAITDAMLTRELARMARGTRMPERLRELYAALGNDPFLVKECLARPALVDRLARNFYAYDGSLHAAERETAESIRTRLASGRLNAWTPSELRTVREFSIGTPRDALSRLDRLTPEEFQKRRKEFPSKVGVASPLHEGCDAIELSVVLDETDRSFRVASYVIPKTSWDEWWGSVESRRSSADVDVVASSSGGLPNPGTRSVETPEPSCPQDDTWDSASLEGVPIARVIHTAVWTGSVMIVWGGYPAYGTTRTNTGGRYDPATDTWEATATLGAPEARRNHSAVWTGSQMVVWGGFYSEAGTNTYFATGGRYDPISDVWLPTSTVGAPSARYGHGVVWTGSTMVIWGGYNGGYLDTGGRYDPVADTWTPTSMLGAPAPRSSLTAVWTGSEMVVWGGSNGTYLGTGGRYDPASNTWLPTSTVGAPSGRSNHKAVWTGTEMIVWGGGASSPVNTGGRYDPTSDAWTPTSTVNAPSARSFFGMEWTGSRVAVWGGASGIIYLDTGGLYDPVADAWSPMATAGAPEPRSSLTVVWTGSRLIVWGGHAYDVPTDTLVYYDTGGRYDPVSDSWTPTSLGDTPSGRQDHTAVWTGNEMVTWGGWDGIARLDTGARYDPAIDHWTATSLAGAPAGRFQHSAVWTGNEMIVWGGYSASHENTGGRYDPIADSWTPTSTVSAPSGRSKHGAVWTGSEMIVWGGDDAAGYPSTGGRYNPITDAWASISNVGAPAGRDYFSCVWTGTTMVVWGGGSDTGYPTLGGRYDPATDAWMPTSTSGAPAGRRFAATVWSGHEMIVWGGDYCDQNGCYYLGDGGRYDPNKDTWSPTSMVGAPTTRAWAPAVWTGRVMVLWGGFDSVDDTATGGRYDPVADVWTPTSTTGAPPARADHTAVWTGNTMIVWGGYAGPYPGWIDSGGRYYVADTTDTDGDGTRDACDDCPAAYDPSQSDTNHDGIGDVCDANDGLIFVFGPPDKSTLSWQQEMGFTSWNVYEGDLEVLRTTGEYTQAPGSNPQAERICGLADTSVMDAVTPPAGHVTFRLVTGVASGVESDLGTDSAGNPRPNTNPCP